MYAPVTRILYVSPVGSVFDGMYRPLVVRLVMPKAVAVMNEPSLSFWTDQVFVKAEPAHSTVLLDDSAVTRERGVLLVIEKFPDAAMENSGSQGLS